MERKVLKSPQKLFGSAEEKKLQAHVCNLYSSKKVGSEFVEYSSDISSRYELQDSPNEEAPAQFLTPAVEVKLKIFDWYLSIPRIGCPGREEYVKMLC